ncbi:RagB/SusD family nutrient uptake outer membrane protein [Algibacter lectus]|uniref:RagB/SusD family nutrient uptake outer membrane protein n=1 Tax=Algibacter lectus TaxID=221126 RepID=UPI0009DF97C2|nr:RagB/SusD family nutrient uptake outer membrane protein [Algibacter lectus]
MKKYIVITLSLTLLLVTLTSCESYLEETNPNEISADIYWSSLEESESNLVSVYGAMLNEFIVNARVESWRSDEGYPGNRFNDRNPNGQEATEESLNWSNHLIDEDTNEVQLRWNALYQVIFRANQVIEGLNGMSDELKSQDLWTLQMGQARFFRGLAHFYLHSVYKEGKIIIRDVNPVTPADFAKAASESADVITFFRKDLEYAYTNLPGQMEPKTKVDAGAAGTILGMSYLYEGDFLTAQGFFDDIINNKEKDYGYALVQDPSLMFTKAGEFNSESILEINYSLHRPEDTNFNEDDFITRSARYSAPRSGGGSSVLETFTAAAWLIHAYSSDEIDPDDPRNTVIDRAGVTRPRKVSLRNSAMLAVVNDEDTEYYQAPSAAVLHNFQSQGKFGYFKKYTNHDYTNSEQNIGVNSWQSGKNVILNRLSGVYLMMAECLNENDDIDGALTYINTVRKRWGLLALEKADYDTKEKIRERLQLLEYPMELCVEGFSTRNIDLRRWGIAKARYTALSQKEFYATAYEYLNEEATGTATRSASLVREGVRTNDADFQIVPEFAGAAEFYTDGYLPYPASETINNPKISN